MRLSEKSHMRFLQGLRSAPDGTNKRHFAASRATRCTAQDTYSDFSDSLNAFGQPTLPRISLISSRSNARIVVRMLPADPSSSKKAERLSISGASIKPTRSW